ncbi:MAG TPA: TonB family protein [Vicinamibacterales bacterium]|nr:TonB family protein [Vicinamibacterales bacterium]
MLAIIVHLLLIIAVLVVPDLGWVKAWRETAAKERVAALQQQRQPERETRFVFVQPRVDLEALRPPPRAPASDINREAMTRERAPDAANRQPRSRGNTTEYVEQAFEQQQPAGRQAQRQGQGEQPQALQAEEPQVRLPEADTVTAYNRAPSANPAAPAGGITPLREALRNLDRYTERAQFDNPTGGQGAFGPWIQFDTKGVEFGPWIRRFVAQVKRNWFVPYAAMSLKGHVVITFNVHRDGTLTDLTVVGPSSVEAFNHAALNALIQSNPTMPLPAEYPAEKAFFTVTFFYNESPPAP